MLAIAIGFFDKLLEKLFFDLAKEKIDDYLARRNVERTISRASEAPAQGLESYFRNEGIDEQKAELILGEVQRAIDAAGVDATTLASASLDPEKLTEIILARYPIPECIRDEQVEWPFQMALRIAADTLCNIGPRFAEWEKEAWRRSFEAFDTLLENQETLLRSVGPGGEGSLDERFAHTYRSHVLRRLAQIDASTLRVSSSLFLDLAAVFVQPDVLPVSVSRKEEGRATQGQGEVLSIEQARGQLLAEPDGEDGGERVPAEQFIGEHRRCAIVGLPGSGKTTLLQHILLASAKGAFAVSADDGVIPVLLRVRDLDPAHPEAADDLLRVSEGRVFAAARPGFLGRQMDAGQVLLLIDGLDEAVARSREDLMGWINDLLELYPGCRYVVSSRPAGYQSDVFHRLGFREAVLCEFTEEQIGQYVRRWTRAVQVTEGATPEEAEETSSRYATALVRRAAKNPYVRRIATNPLMLSTLCLVQRYEGGDLPNRRVVLYQRCVEGLLFHWDKKRGLPSAILGALPLDRKMMILRRLALEMQVQGVAEATAAEVLDSFQISLGEVGDSADPILILENIRDRSGLLLERRPAVYGFSHLTFQEYLAALSVNSSDYPGYDRLFLFSKRSDPQWSEVIALYAGLGPRDSVESLLEELVAAGHADSILLAGESLAAAQNIRLPIQKRVIRALLGLPGHSIEGRLFAPVQTILELLDEGIVFAEAAASLGNLDVAHAMRFFFFKRNPAAIQPLLEVGRRILSGEQPPGRWDDGVSINLLLIEDPEAAWALGELAEMASTEAPLGDRANVFLGLWEVEFWPREFPAHGDAADERISLPGVLRFLQDPSATQEHMSLCRFLSTASSDEVLREMIPEPEGRAEEVRLLRVVAPPDLLVEAVEHLGQHGARAVRKSASGAAESLTKAVDTVKTFGRERPVVALRETEAARD